MHLEANNLFIFIPIFLAMDRDEIILEHFEFYWKEEYFKFIDSTIRFRSVIFKNCKFYMDLNKFLTNNENYHQWIKIKNWMYRNEDYTENNNFIEVKNILARKFLRKSKNRKLNKRKLTNKFARDQLIQFDVQSK